MVGNARVVQMGDISVTEEIVTVDDDLRRFQYSITEMPIPIEFHLSTIDVLARRRRDAARSTAST